MKLKILILSCALSVATNSPAAAEPAASPVDWMAQVSKAILDGRCDDAKIIALQANDLNVAEQALRLCKPAIKTISTSVDGTGADLPINNTYAVRVQKVEQPKSGSAPLTPVPMASPEQKTTTASAAIKASTPLDAADTPITKDPQSRGILGINDIKIPLKFTSSVDGVIIVANYFGHSAFLGKVDYEHPSEGVQCSTPCTILVPNRHEMQYKLIGFPTGYTLDGPVPSTQWKETWWCSGGLLCAAKLEPNPINIKLKKLN